MNPRPDPRLFVDPPGWNFEWRNAAVTARIAYSRAMLKIKRCYPYIPRLNIGLPVWRRLR